jgi:hypothetical protein
MDTQDVTVGDMGSGEPHTFFGWTTNGGDEITRIEFRVTDGLQLAALDNFLYESVVFTPVPTAAWLFGSGLLGLIGIGRRRQTTA